MSIDFERLEEDPIENSNIEIVERKGLGHPDTICDSIAEKVSEKLCEAYEERFGKILHHNTDEVQLVAGSSRPEFSGGEIEERIYILLAGRATKEYNDEKIPVDKLAVEAAEEFIEDNFKVLRPGHIEFESRIGPTSGDLESVYEREEVLSNDTSFGAGHYPLSDAEELALDIGEEVRDIHEAGEDVKVLIEREGTSVDVTVAVAGISSRIEDLEAYRNFVEKVESTVIGIAEESFPEVDVTVNSADDIENGDVYLTVTGTSAENGDDGSVGRGNRFNGLITPMRSMSLEAHSGKNPVTHVGKINQRRAHEISKKVYEETGEFCKAYVVNRIGEEVSEPRVHLETSGGSEEIREIEFAI
jgi:S-adenosylmethionine synthetase